MDPLAFEVQDNSIFSSVEQHLLCFIRFDSSKHFSLTVLSQLKSNAGESVKRSGLRDRSYAMDRGIESI